jgi:hypothetical protein
MSTKQSILFSIFIGNHPYHSVSVTEVTVDDVRTTSLLR